MSGAKSTLISEHVEVESGRNVDRPNLRAAVDLCRLTGASLLIAKLDRLSRDAHFLLGLEKAGVDFVACDMPTANRLTIGIMALVAEEEARAISARTKAALAVAKARGTTLGGWRGGPLIDGRFGAVAVRKSADSFAASLKPRIKALKQRGLSLREIAASLDADGILTARGGSWTAAAVLNVLNRDRC
jgi:DNA invertase Pin-like site-specific DNA recombinase